jgi:hypothetical protein
MHINKLKFFVHIFALIMMCKSGKVDNNIMNVSVHVDKQIILPRSESR